MPLNGIQLIARAAWFHPLYWFLTLCIATLPRLFEVWFRGYRIHSLAPGPGGLMLLLRTPSGEQAPFNSSLSLRLMVITMLVLGVVALLRKRPVISGMAIAVLAQAAAANLAVDAFFRRDGYAMAGIAACLPLAIWGVRRMSMSEIYWVRLLEAAVALVLPAILVYTLLPGGGPRRGGPTLILTLSLIPVVVLGALGTSRHPRVHFGWRHLALPALASLLILAGTRAGEAYAIRARESRLQSQLNAVEKTPPSEGYARLFFQRGISYTRDGMDAYYPEQAARVLDSLHQYGINAIALVPYGYSRRDGSDIRFDRTRSSWRLYEALGHMARAKGIRILLKPQIWAGGFPGNIEIGDSESRRRWFEWYTEFIEEHARLATAMHADLFCVGTEFVRLSRHEAEWREIIANVRRLYPGPLVYAATQGEEFESLRFWDALDYIGLNNYYPLADDLSIQPVMQKIEAVQQRFGKPVIFTEAGFASVGGAHREPWAEPQRAVDVQHQAKCYEAIFQAFYSKPWFYGMYWWKVAGDGRGGPLDRSLTPWRKPAMDVVGRWYRGGGR